MLQCVLNSVKTIKTKGRIDFQKFKEDFDVFVKNIEFKKRQKLSGL